MQTLILSASSVLLSLSLQLNSLGFYQLMKVLTTPAIVVIQLVAFSVPLHNKSALSRRESVAGGRMQALTCVFRFPSG